MNRPDVVIENIDLLGYIEYLESIANGRSRLEVEMNLFEDAIADDMALIRTGEAKEDESNLKYIRTDKRGEKLAGIIKLYKESPKSKKAVGEDGLDKPAKKRSVQDFILAK